MTRLEKIEQLKSKKQINCLFINSNERVFKLDPLIDKMRQYSIFNIKITKSLTDIQKKYDDIDLYFPCQPYTYRITSSQKTLQKLYNDKKIVIVKYSLGWNKSFESKNRIFLFPNYQNSFLNFVDSPDLVLDDHYIFSGHPWSEKLLNNNNRNPYTTTKKKVLICFHWTISSYGTGRNHTVLLSLGNDILNICLKYQDKIEFVFRPHQILFDLYCGIINNKLFRLDVTEKYSYYKEAVDKAREILFKISTNFPLISDIDYIPWFKYSDAMIHDCGSYRCEYLYMNKPVAYLASKNNLDSTEWSEMGKDAMNCHTLLYNKEQFENFLIDLLENKDDKEEIRLKYKEKYIDIHMDKTPSEKIIESLLR